MPHDHSKKQETIDYFDAYVQAFSRYMRLHESALNNCFLGAARRKVSMQLYFGNSVFCARLLGSWKGAPTVEWQPDNLTDLTTCKYEISIKKMRAYDLVFGIQVAFGKPDIDPKFLCDGSGPKFDNQNRLKLFTPQGTCGLWVTAPHLIPSRIRNKYESGKISRRQELTQSARLFRPSWILQWFSTDHDPLRGLETDPKIAGYGAAENLLGLAGFREGSPEQRFIKAGSALALAVARQSKTNEPAIHDVISKNPEILVIDYESFYSKKKLRFTENVKNEDGTLTPEIRTIVPDFVYVTHDQKIVCVEIEAYGKRLFTTGVETNFAVPSAATNRASYQIENYKTIIDGYGGNEIREQLGCPSVAPASFLLVVGSKDQKDFDERSWMHRQTQLAKAGIELQSWDYYLDRLSRLAKASAFSVL
ncbi:Shedu anti-phage system protein SduA domain-containing protein [Nitratireductor sp. XY-223]|uniref:Shedu anti-phage system protein SduA domain-containing protein n=1 Tax=Nitratireductor sp. XY-223 TaxID=2561926 RepID=UPI0010AA0278|nr:Shedu anti-phage system protein SduA domain-containing protein [Nitratireductor sp. XY-223]